MNLRCFLILPALCLSAASLPAQAPKEVPVQIRAVLIDPVNPVVDMFVRSAAGQMEKIGLIANNLSEAQMIAPSNGSLVIYKTAAVDPEKPREGVIGTGKLPADAKRVIVVIVPTRAEGDPTYRLVMIDDSAKGFPKGESRVLSLVPVETALEAGEHKLPIASGKVTKVPAVRKVNDFNMAQTNFYYREGGSWVPFTERQLQYLDEFRRIFLIHVSPGAIQPSVTTILDVVAAPVPAG